MNESYMSTTPLTRRRWFQFSLRTLFVVTTLCTVWMGTTLTAARRAVAERQLALQTGCYPICDENSPSVRDGLPLSWRLLGAEPVWLLGVKYQADAKEVERLEALFPEGGVLVLRQESLGTVNNSNSRSLLSTPHLLRASVVKTD